MKQLELCHTARSDNITGSIPFLSDEITTFAELIAYSGDISVVIVVATPLGHITREDVLFISDYVDTNTNISIRIFQADNESAVARIATNANRINIEHYRSLPSIYAGGEFIDAFERFNIHSSLWIFYCRHDRCQYPHFNYLSSCMRDE
ncbi:MAG: hypothetical protein FWF78_08325 [Defluviitaleaceae bacterium]|nr:hypothetical protein [Defluviitaleaceae bacterium]